MMLLKSGGGTAMAVPCRPLWRPMCLASNINSEQLRAELGQLHSEADTTRDKANNARLRLLRLSEAAEKLRRQAAINVRTGKEDDAREILFQKKKVMQALEKSKKRIELLDELSTKLNERHSYGLRNLYRWGSVDHVFVHCEVALLLWKKLFREAGVNWASATGRIDLLSEKPFAFSRGKKGQRPQFFWCCGLLAVGWSRWKEIEGSRSL